MTRPKIFPAPATPDHSERDLTDPTDWGLATRLVRGTSLNQPDKNVEHALVTSGVGIPTGGAILGRLDWSCSTDGAS